MDTSTLYFILGYVAIGSGLGVLRYNKDQELFSQIVKEKEEELFGKHEVLRKMEAIQLKAVATLDNKEVIFAYTILWPINVVLLRLLGYHATYVQAKSDFSIKIFTDIKKNLEREVTPPVTDEEYLKLAMGLGLPRSIRRELQLTSLEVIIEYYKRKKAEVAQ